MYFCSEQFDSQQEILSKYQRNLSIKKIWFQNYFFSKINFWTVKTVLETSFINLPNPEKPILSFPQPVNLADIFETTNRRTTLNTYVSFSKSPMGFRSII